MFLTSITYGSILAVTTFPLRATPGTKSDLLPGVGYISSSFVPGVGDGASRNTYHHKNLRADTIALYFACICVEFANE